MYASGFAKNLKRGSQTKIKKLGKNQQQRTSKQGPNRNQTETPTNCHLITDFHCKKKISTATVRKAKSAYIFSAYATKVSDWVEWQLLGWNDATTGIIDNYPSLVFRCWPVLSSIPEVGSSWSSLLFQWEMRQIFRFLGSASILPPF